MDLKKIKALLENFYKGDTTLEEEKILREYFSNKVVDNELIADKDIFLYQVHEVESDGKIPDMSNEIWNSLNENASDKPQKNRQLAFVYLRIAASIIILLGSYFILKNQVFNKQQNIQFTDTYSNPEQAYEQAKETLLYVSAMLNNGASHLEPIQKINEGTKELNKLSSFNEGLKKLNPINKYNIANKYFKQ